MCAFEEILNDSKWKLFVSLAHIEQADISDINKQGSNKSQFQH